MANGIDIVKLGDAIDNCCLYNCEKCVKNKCLVGYSQNVLKYYKTEQKKLLSDGINMIPREDCKVYSQDDLIDALAEVLVQCKQCKENHQEDCVVNVIRESIERALFGENLIDFEGNSLSYVMNVMESSVTIGEELMATYREKKK